MRVLLVSTYELGHQPLHLAAPAGRLAAAGHDVVTVDTAVQAWDPEIVDGTDAVAFSVPMHTATRLAIAAARSIRARRPEVPIAFYGLYADMGAGVADHVFAGEYMERLLGWVGAAADAGGTPLRTRLPALESYGRLRIAGEERLAGYVEASRGCVHRCRHCPVPVVYDGRIKIEAVDALLADIDQQVAAGARHITFGDPDFLNGPHHASRVVAALHDAFPDVTFDCTTKVEHILKHPDLWPTFAASNCLFVVSAFESVNDHILRRLDKGHTAREAIDALHLVRNAGIDVRPSWLPFTPWTTHRDVVDILDFVAQHRLVASTDPVQYTIRLLLPQGSFLLRDPDFEVGAWDAERLSYGWESPLDGLQARLAELVEAGGGYAEIRAAAGAAPIEVTERPEPPRLTESWFCCAEPTQLQLGSISSRAEAVAAPTRRA